MKKKKKKKSYFGPGSYDLPASVVDACKKGLEYYEAGFGGDGLVDETIAQAKIAVSDGVWASEKILKARAWFARHESDLREDSFDEESPRPGGVAWLLWGSDPADGDKGREFIEEAARILDEAENLDRADNDSPTLLEELAQAMTPEEEEEEEEELPIAAIEMAQLPPMDVETGGDLHVCRLGPLHDLDSGDLILSLDDESAEELATTTQKMIEAGHTLPISMEHGIEAGQRGVDNADRRPYGEVSKIYFDKEKGGIFAVKSWTKLGRDVVEAAETDDGSNAYRISPRIRFTPAFHPMTGEELGPQYIDVISLTTLPRTSGLEPVQLSRTTSEDTDSQEITEAHSVPQTPAELGRDNNQEEPIMADQNQTPEEEIFLSRGSEETKSIATALGLEVTAPANEFARKVEAMRGELVEAIAELSRYKQEESDRLAADKAAAVEAELEKYEFGNEAEKTFFRASLLSSDENTVELAQTALEERGKPDHAAIIDDAILAAKERGALSADYVLTEELRTLADQGTELAVNLINAIPAGNVVTIDTPAGSDVAGTETVTTITKAEAEYTLSRIAREKKNGGEAKNMIEAYELARTERGDLAALIYGE